MPVNLSAIRLATEHDAETIRHLAELDGRPSWTAAVLIAEDRERTPSLRERARAATHITPAPAARTEA